MYVCMYVCKRARLRFFINVVIKECALIKGVCVAGVGCSRLFFFLRVPGPGRDVCLAGCGHPTVSVLEAAAGAPEECEGVTRSHDHFCAVIIVSLSAMSKIVYISSSLFLKK